MKKIIQASLLALPLAVSSAYAQTSEGPTYKISGFGTGALTWSDTNDAEFVRPNQASGVTKSPRPGVDSNLGLQVDSQINDWLSLTGQGLVRKDGTDDYGAELTWAFAKAKVSDHLSFRAGRVVLPVFMISDYRNVGYANTFLRPPAEVYSLVMVNSLDGIDGTWQQAYGDTNFTVQASFGRSKGDLGNGGDVTARRIANINFVAEHGPLTLRVGHAHFGAIDIRLQGATGASLNTLKSTFTTVGNAYHLTGVSDAAQTVNFHDIGGSFTSIGAGLDWNNVIAQSEYARRKLGNYTGQNDAWYVLAGYRFGKFLPYYTHSKLTPKGDFSNSIPTACPTGYGAACTPTVAALHNALEGLRASSLGQAQHTDTLGLRWDAFSSADIKFQIDRVHPAGNGLFVNAKPGFHGPVTVGSVAVDFVF